MAYPDKSYALILGASSGFGAATALELAERGMNIFGVHLDRSSTMPAVLELEERLRSKGVDVQFYNLNAADGEKRGEVLDAISETFNRNEGSSIKLLLHSLAFGTLRPFIGGNGEKAITQSQLEMTLNVMANSLVYWTQDIVARGLIGPGGRILALSSSGSHRVLPTYGAVSAAKAALESYCRQLAFELGPLGISVNSILAGVTDTPALRKIPGNHEIIENATQRNPLGRLTTPRDVASVIAMLAEDDAGWINGSVIQVDGGEGVVELDWRQANVVS